MARRRREIVIRIPPMARQDLDKFLEKLSKALYGDTVIGSIEGDTIRLYIYGSRLAQARTVRLVRRLLREYSSPSRGGMRSYSIRHLSREAGTALPPDLLVEVLRLKGYRAEWGGGDRLLTSAPPEVVLETARLIADAIRRLANTYATRTVKRMLAGLLALDPAMQVRSAIDLIVGEGFARYDEEGKLVPSADWREALKKLYRMLTMGGGEEGHD